jgi:hypothetical protein
MSGWDFRSQDSDEVQEFLGGIYAENEFKIFGKKGQPSRTRIYGADVGNIAQYNVSYSSPFTFLSETVRDFENSHNRRGEAIGFSFGSNLNWPDFKIR